ncbi:hypothetical protein [Ulvibacterium marinum]|uniref:Uncharacterized protein n=1 Tax=Ulvibacterium marinum TaxID=2419782 RepID=A0A3B0CCW4_9FLAO|nr:hypothetical protein [Ulvibacterium marinum]RKN82408.1 hypothetical protein D7Z94_00710 [Ulvibacterium marinum]
MKFVVGLICSLALWGASTDISELRKTYPKANASEQVTDKLFTELSPISKTDDAVLVAYKGAISTLKAKYAQGLRNKKDFFKSGAELIEYAVATKPKNIEIRCIRLSVQENSPKVVGYKENIEEDKGFLLHNFANVSSEEIREFVKNYAMQSSVFDASEKQLFSGR